MTRLAYKYHIDLVRNAGYDLTMNTVINKTCSCGATHLLLPAGFRYLDEPVIGGFFFECACGTTLVLKEEELQIDVAAA